MLFKVLNQDYKVEFMDYGTIEIPKGTKVDDKGYEDPGIRYCLISEYDWIDDKYPHQSHKMKADAIAHGIAVPKEMPVKALRVCFVYDDSGNCRDIYKAVDREYKFCRMESRLKDKVQWFTVTDDWEEPDCPLRSDMLIQLMDKEGKVAAIEQQEKINGESVSEKTFPFSWEKTQATQQEHLMGRIYSNL